MYEQQFNPFGGNLAIVKGYFRSGKILTLGIFYVISIVLSFILTASDPLPGCKEGNQRQGKRSRSDHNHRSGPAGLAGFCAIPQSPDQQQGDAVDQGLRRIRKDQPQN